MAPLEKKPDDIQRRRLPHVRNIRLVRDSEHEDVRPIHRKAILVQERGDLGRHVLKAAAAASLEAMATLLPLALVTVPLPCRDKLADAVAEVPLAVQVPVGHGPTLERDMYVWMRPVQALGYGDVVAGELRVPEEGLDPMTDRSPRRQFGRLLLVKGKVSH